jgi:predicted class III extradiol MEMO1 family dioxygenase
MTDRRRASVAGSWYPNDPATLAGAVDRYVSAADVDPIPSHLRALVAPHAGLMYSGPVAAFAYKAARDTNYATVVMVGPSHFVPFRGVSIWPRGSWDTPFGPVEVDEALASAIAESPAVVEQRAAHGREHSLEMQMPFVAHVLPGSRIVPLVMGLQTRETAHALGDALARAIAARTPAVVEAGSGPGPRRGPGEVLLVASSDLSHYEDARTAAAMDGVVLQHVEALDPDGLMDALEREPRHACGGGPMVAVLRAARQLGAQHARVLRYADSGDVSGDKSAVVGYMAAAIW